MQISRKNSLIEMRRRSEHLEEDRNLDEVRIKIFEESKMPLVRKPMNFQVSGIKGDNEDGIDRLSMNSEVIKQNPVISSELEVKFKQLIDILDEPMNTWELVLKKDNLNLIEGLVLDTLPSFVLFDTYKHLIVAGFLCLQCQLHQGHLVYLSLIEGIV